MGMLTNLNLSIGEKFGQQYTLGYGDSVKAPGNDVMHELDGCTFTGGLTDKISVSCPLMCVLSNAEKLLPLFMMPQVKLQLSVDNIASIFTSSVTPSAFTISNFELRYKVCDFGGQVETMLRAASPKIMIKSQSFGVSSQTLGVASGAQSLVFNQRYASVKSLFAINGTTTTTGNQAFDSVNLAAGNTSYSFQVGGVQYPQKALNAGTNRGAIYNELRSAVGSVFDRTNSMSIDAYEFSFDGVNAATTLTSPAKFYVATSCERLGSDSLLTGVSTENSPINYNINLASQTSGSSQITLVVNHDAIFEIDAMSGETRLRV